MAGHALALEHASRRLALTDGTRRAVRHRVAVSLHAARKIVALHGAGEALAHRGPGDIDDLTRGEHVDFQLGAGCQSVALALVQAEFLGSIAGGDIGLGEMARQRLGNPRWATAASSDLHRAIAVGFVTFDLRDAVRQRLDDRHGDSHTGVGEYSGHAALAANQTNGHCQNPQAGRLRLAPAVVAISRRFRQRTPITLRQLASRPRAPTSKIGRRIIYEFAGSTSFGSQGPGG